MGKQSKRKKHARVTVVKPTKFLFSFTAVRMLRDALRLVDEAITRNTKPLPNLEFGQQTLDGLKAKLNYMLQAEDWEKETPFDYNEMLILYAAIHMHLVDLSLKKDDQLMPVCLQLCKHFSRVVDAVPPALSQSN